MTILLALLRRGHGAGPNSAYPTRPLRIIVPGTRRHEPRSAGAHHLPPPVSAPRPVDRHREPAGRRRKHRHRRSGEGNGGRLHPARDERPAFDQRVALQQSPASRGQELRARRAGHRLAAGADRSSGASDQGCRRTDELREGQPRQSQFRLAADRHARPSRRRALQAHAEDRNHSRAVPGRDGRHPRSHGGPDPDAVRHAAARGRADPGGHGARARRDHGRASTAPSRRCLRSTSSA